MNINLMTFNLRYPFGKDGDNSWENRKNAVAAFINEMKPTVVGTQEAYDFMKDEILELCQDYKDIGIPRTPKGEGVPILYNYNILEVINSGNFWLSETPRHLNSKSWESHSVRMCTWAEFTFIDDRTKKFRLFNVHLDNISEEARINGFNVILEKYKRLNQFEDIPTFIVGDFNAKPSSTTIKMIEQSIDQGNHKLKHTYKNGFDYGTTFHDFTGRTNGEPIDYIFHSLDANISNLQIHRNKAEDVYLSDHYPVSIDIKF